LLRLYSLLIANIGTLIGIAVEKTITFKCDHVIDPGQSGHCFMLTQPRIISVCDVLERYIGFL